jgi:hypothetical protein
VPNVPSSCTGRRRWPATPNACARPGSREEIPRKKRSLVSLSQEQRAFLLHLIACGPAAAQLLAQGLIEREIVDTISHETVRQTRKKTRSSSG